MVAVIVVCTSGLFIVPAVALRVFHHLVDISIRPSPYMLCYLPRPYFLCVAFRICPVILILVLCFRRSLLCVFPAQVTSVAQPPRYMPSTAVLQARHLIWSICVTCVCIQQGHALAAFFFAGTSACVYTAVTLALAGTPP